ncbi:MAG TPA: hydroxymethylbilane synthase [Micropruina sp.]|nr:hydroxymethylbilane synthase [Micropruina sp.]
MQIRLATRGSRLALAQSGMIADALRDLGATVELVRVRTFGDASTAPLATIGGTGVFVVAVREAVLNGACDIAVHSLKDLPTTPADGLAMAAIPAREDPRDALCARDGLGLAALPFGARVGTGSPRRVAQLALARPDLELVDIRGNVDTRLARVSNDLDAVVLAVAGLNRIGRSDAISEYLDPDLMVPAPAQGALAIECRSDDTAVRALLAELDHPDTRAAIELERSVMRLVEAGCSAPFGALATVANGWLSAHVRLVNGPVDRRAMGACPVGDTGRLAEQLADQVAPLRGLRVLMPMSGMASPLSAAGASVTQVRLTRTELIEVEPLLAAVASGGFDTVAFTSARTPAVLAESGVDLADLLPAEVRVAAVGPATAAAVEGAGLRVDLRVTAGGGAALAEALGAGGAVLVPGAEDPAPGLAAGLQAAGRPVIAVPVYRTVATDNVDAAAVAGWPQDYDAFVVTAPSAARAAAALLGLPGPPVVALGSTSATAAGEAGFEVVAVAAEPTAAGLTAALTQRRKDRA